MDGNAKQGQGGGGRHGRRSSKATTAALCIVAATLLPGLCSYASDILPSTRPPGGFAPSNTPQIVLLTFDDSVTTASLARVQQALTNHVNPNGHAIKATFFVTVEGLYDPAAVRQLYDAGHEIAMHTMSHATSETSSLIRWRQEIAGERRTLSELCGIPAEEIVGFRAPCLKPNDDAFRVLSERRFLYDSSFPEYLSGFSTATTNMLWPYTLDHGLQQVAASELKPATNYPGLFEIPIWVQFSNTTAVILMDPPDTLSSDAVTALWKTNFLSHYHGNRAPYGIFLHATSADQWLANPTNSAERISALGDFIDWTLAQPDTWFITCHDLVDFMLAPVPASAAATSLPFLTPVRTQFPTSAIRRCSFPGSHTLNVCGSCPPAAPNYTNAYLGLVPMDGGSVALNILSQSTDYAWCEMVVSNNVPQCIYDWSASFTLRGGTVQGLYDATWTQIVDQVYADAQQYNTQIYPGAARRLTFRVLRSGGDVTFAEESMAASGLGPQPIWLALQPLSSSAAWRITWDDNAYLYGVECATNLLSSQNWMALTNGLCVPEITEPHATDGFPRFYRVKGTLY